MKELTDVELRRALVSKLASSALSPADGKAMKLETRVASATKSLNLPAVAGGFMIPYFDCQRKPTKFFRFRYMEDTRKGFDKVTGRKPLRYAQPIKAHTEIYLPPQADWKALKDDADIPLLITEGELKAACSTVHGYPCLGLGGVWSFQSQKESQPLLPTLEAFEWEEREVYIVFDSDAATNPDVVMAEGRLAARLMERGAIVSIVRIPAHKEVQKMGLDDYVMLVGPDNAPIAELLEKFSFPFSASEILHDLNKRIVYVRDPGLIWDFEDGLRRTPSAFKEHAFSNIHIMETRTKKDMKTGKATESSVKTSAAKAWLEWEYRAEVLGLTYAPGGERVTADGKLNVWKGWGVSAPIPGDVSHWHALMRHLFADDVEARKWFEQWCAFPLQHPGVKMATAAALWGNVHGSGKTLVGHTLMRIYGKNAAELKDSDLEDDRNEWAENLQFVLADDITSRGDRKFMRRLMTMITQKYMRLNIKYVPSYSIADFINYYFTSNDPDALFMDDGDRRFFVHEVLAGKFGPWKEYVVWRDSDEGICALWHYLLSFDVTGFDPQAPAPMTVGKESMIDIGKSDLGSWVRELRTNTEHVLDKANYKGDLFTAAELYTLYDPANEKRASPNALARELKRVGIRSPATGSRIRLLDGTMKMVYAVRNPDKWSHAGWKEAGDHYNAHHTNLGKNAKKKF